MHKLCSLPVTLLAAPAAFAAPQSPFASVAEVTDTTSNAVNVVPVDMNLDGVEDLVVGVDAGRGVKVLLGRGDGTFERSYRVGEAAGVVAHVETADWNGDGLPDLLFGVQEPTTWRVFVGLANGAGRDLEVQQVANGADILEGLAGEDMDGDGDVDLVVHERIPGFVQPDGRLSWFQQSSSGLGSTPNVIYFFDRFQDFSIEDGDGDGIVDVIIFVWAFGGPVFHRGLGQGAYSSIIDSAGGFIGHISLDVGDLDGDGLADVVTLTNTRVEVFLANGSFSYTYPATDLGPTSLVNPRDMKLVDFDGDGDLDIYVMQEYPWTPGAAVVLENANGVFQPAQPAYLGERITRGFADLNGDGNVDLMTMGERSLELRPYRSLVPPGSTTRFEAPLNVTAPLEQTLLLGAFDVDGDSFEDAFALNDGDVVWFRNRGDLSFSPQPALFPFTSAFQVMYGAELTGDGLLDIVTIEQMGAIDVIRMRPSLAGGGFAAPIDLASAGDFVRVYPIDVDGDGDNDLVSTPESTGTVTLRVLLNDGSGGFSVGPGIGPLAGWARNLLRTDLDLDGHPDLVASAGTSIQVAKGQSGGGYLPFAPVYSGAVANQLGAADFSGDGRPDLYAYINGEIQWLRQTLQATFEAPTPIQPGLDSSLSILQVADFDQDGVLDLLSGTRDASVDSAFLRGTAPGTFAPAAPLIEGEPAPVDVMAADADGDGDLDLFYRSDEPLRIGVMVNETVPTTGVSVCSPALPNSSGLSATAHALGAPDATAASLTLRATKLPPNQFGLFAGSRTFQSPVAVPGSAGQLCLAGSIGRYIGPGQILSSGPFGSFDIQVHPTALVDASGTTPAFAGDTWYFQAWFRDVSSQGGATSNFTDAIAVTFE